MYNDGGPSRAALMRFSIAAVLAVLCIVTGASFTAPAWQVGFLVPGLLYLATALAIVFMDEASNE